MEYLLLLRNRWLVFIHDVLWVPPAIIFSFWVRFNLSHIPDAYIAGMLKLIVVALFINALLYWVFGCYRGIWRYASIPDLVRIIKAVLFGALVTALGMFLFDRLNGIPRSIFIIYPVFLMLGLIGSRITYRMFKDAAAATHNSGERALIVGAGRAGELLIRDLKHHGPFIPAALVDDDASKLGHELHGVRVRGTVTDLERIIRSQGINIVLVAMPSVSRLVMDRVVQVCNREKIICRTLPSLTELAGGKVEVSRLRPVTVEDLLGRDPVALDVQSVSTFLSDKRVLVTGGGGSIGSELCRQLLLRNPEQLVVVDNSEFNLYCLEQELYADKQAAEMHFVLGDVKNAATIKGLFDKYHPHIVFHAAAYKHVSMVEQNILEGVRNNVVGTQVVANAAIQAKSDCFVLISTDKTVNPTSVMGASKRIAELYCQALKECPHTRFITTRFGNVLGSRGSVVPLFERQITKGGPVTVTHPDVTRYFMTIHEAAALILQSAAMGYGGEIFVLDMGQPIRIRDLADNMIKLNGLQPEKDIKIVYTGLRPGEKLHEELFYNREQLRHTAHPKLLLADCCRINTETFLSEFEKLRQALETGSAEGIVTSLRAIIPEYIPSLPIDTMSVGKEAQPSLRIVR